MKRNVYHHFKKQVPIARRDEGPEVAEDEEVVSICQVMEKTYTEIAKEVLGRAKKMRKKKKT